MLINVNEEIPEEFYVFVNFSSPIAVNNFRVGAYTSAACSMWLNEETLRKYLDGSLNYLPFAPSERDPIAISPYCLTAINDYRIEYDAEMFRKQHFPLYPSRLSATYAFGDIETCYEVSRKYGWDISTVRKFKLLDTPLNRVAKVNMDHVSLARHAYKVASMQNVDDLWHAYWTGIGNIQMELPDGPDFSRNIRDSGVIWEYLVEGCLKPIA
ncbi:hypothetical protein FLL96_19405 [Vibrio cholerae]|uniref:hypothetical protein n=1 Tax=Gammaproteobacteria TaxID=1236 RepID=UPI00115C21E7|nr:MULTISPECIES: hypothetical protein [Vibrio]EGQ8476278.1 hypothetical protein [Vibrio cholerae]EGR1265461.1 hypothetical protein [Vibrio cholerae]EHD2282538.1 hypothetical protein [Vibrio cholerae]EJL6488838.1 hypothetical protein [Vibrio cholerae]EJL6891183.1 hypothetical protein [Vibrio cholerae]